MDPGQISTLNRDSQSQGQEGVRRRQPWESPVDSEVLGSTSYNRKTTSYVLQDRINSTSKRPGHVEEEEEGDPLFEEDFSKDLNNGQATQVLELAISILIFVALLCTLNISALRDKKIWKPLLWQWEATALILVFGRFACRWIFKILVLFIRRSFLLRKRFLYFIYESKKAIHNSLWLVWVLLLWYNLFHENVETDTQSRALRNVIKVLVCVAVSLILWLGKTLLMKALISHFYITTYFDKVLDSLFIQYVIAALSSPQNRSQRLSQDQEISIDLLRKLNPKNVSAWTMKRMMNIIQHGALFTLDERGTHGNESIEIKGENVAEEGAKIIFQNVANPGSEYINLEDIERFIRKDEALKTMRLIEGGPEISRISESTLKRWVVKALTDWEALCLSLDDMTTIINKLHLLVNVLLIIITQMILLFIIGIATGGFFEAVFYVCSQLLALSFIFGNTLQSTFEAVIFLFAMHPFDVGDLCEIDKVQLKVEKINIFSTTFLKFDDNQTSIIPNKVLATKTIDNFNHSPTMKEKIAFCIHTNTPEDKVVVMEQSIKSYVNNNKVHWYPDPKIICEDIVELDRLKFQVSLQHRMNGQDKDERCSRRENLVKGIAKILTALEINKIG